MSLLRSRDVGALLDAVDRIYQPVSAASFANHLFAILGDLLPGSITSFDSVELATGKVESHICPDGVTAMPVAELEAVVREFLHQHPVVGHLARHPASVIRPTDLVSQREFRRTGFYQHCFRPAGVEYQIAGGIDQPGYAGAFIINRGGPHDFTDREVELIYHLRPHVVRACGHGLLLEDLRRRLEMRAAETARNGGGLDFDPGWLAEFGLTGRELEVLRWVSEGKRDGEIAIILNISVRTIHKHAERLYSKLGVETRTAAALLARGM